MEAIILAGGFGTRLRSVVSDVPKPMAPVGNRPFLELLLDCIIPYGFDHIVLSTGYMHEKIKEHFGDKYKGVRLSYAVEETALGTGGGMRNAIEHCKEDSVTVLNGDTLFRIDYEKLKLFHKSHSNISRLSVVLRQVDDISRYGSVTTDNDGIITGFTEKKECSTPISGTINGGIYMMHRSLLEEHVLGERFSFEKEILQSRYTIEPFYAYTSDAFFLDIGIPEDYHKLTEQYA
ncbi:MAG: nucleotidyltransferase family protein [Bacteroidales bacterium]|nr:nucleotidyltransferase family protein [Bacteroidales bacterium]